MAKSYRKERLNESIKEMLSELVLTGVRDPRVGLVTITAVDVAADYESAKVYYTVLGGEAEREESRNGLESAKSYLRKTIARNLKVHSAPELRFVYDDTLDRSMRIEAEIKKIHERDDEHDE